VTKTLLLSGFLALVAFRFTAGADAQSSRYSNLQLIYGPLACAADTAYHKWLSGPLGGTPPTSSSFSAALSATADPYTITFSPTSGSTPPAATYSIASSTCLSSVWASGPTAVQYSKGPLTLGGEYILALVSADALHDQAEPGGFDPGNTFAYLNSPGSGVAISTNPSTRSGFLVGYYQYYAQSNSSTVFVGCYKEQHYLVSRKDFAATKTTIGCPG